MKPPRSYRRMTIPEKAHPLVRRLYVEMNRQRTNPRDVEDRAGLGQFTINQWRTKRSPDINAITAALNVLGLRLCVKTVEHDDGGNEVVPAGPPGVPLEAQPNVEIIC